MKKLFLSVMLVTAVALVSCSQETQTTVDQGAAIVADAGDVKCSCGAGTCTAETCSGGECKCETCVCKCPCGCRFEGEWECDDGVCTRVLTCGCKCTATCGVKEDGSSRCECSYECPDGCADGCKCMNS